MTSKQLILKIVFFCFTIYSSQNIIAQTSSKQPLKRDWFKQDPKDDSIAGISLLKAYALLIKKKPKTIIVAVIDNGVDIEHEDLKNVIWTNKKEIPNNGIDDDDNGYIDDVHGWNFRGTSDGTIIEKEQSASTQFYKAWKSKFEVVDTNLLSSSDKENYIIYQRAKKDYLDKLSSKDSIDNLYTYNINYHSYSIIKNDDSCEANKFYGSAKFKLSVNTSHGTHVAGIIAAQRNNNVGIDGIADKVLIMPIVATTVGGDERDKDVANAIMYAVNNGARIINMSFSKLFSSDKGLIDEAIRYAEKKNVLIIHAAGNDGANIDSEANYHYPVAIYDDGKRAGNFITVGWSRALFDHRLAHPYSDYGKLNVDLFAPGSDIFSTVPNNNYDFKSGSSMATPVVTGIAALLLSYFPDLSAKQIKEILLKSSFKPNQMVNKPQTTMQVSFDKLSVSGGILNAYNAVKMAIAMTENK
jgi:subtilisin family serine protease